MRTIKGMFLLSMVLLADLWTVPIFKQTEKMNVNITYEMADPDKDQEIIPALETIEAVLETYRKSYIVCNQVSDGCEIAVYQRSQKVFSETYPVEPGITEIMEGIYEIRISVGSPAAYVYYIDTQDFKISAVYFNPIFFGSGYVAYMEDRVLILTDLFQEGILDERIARDFTKTADPMSAIRKVEMQDDDNIRLEYYKGADYMEESEIIRIGETEDEDLLTEPESTSVTFTPDSYWAGYQQ